MGDGHLEPQAGEKKGKKKSGNKTRGPSEDQEAEGSSAYNNTSPPGTLSQQFLDKVKEMRDQYPNLDSSNGLVVYRMPDVSKFRITTKTYKHPKEVLPEAQSQQPSQSASSPAASIDQSRYAVVRFGPSLARLVSFRDRDREFKDTIIMGGFATDHMRNTLLDAWMKPLFVLTQTTDEEDPRGSSMMQTRQWTSRSDYPVASASVAIVSRQHPGVMMFFSGERQETLAAFEFTSYWATVLYSSGVAGVPGSKISSAEPNAFVQAKDSAFEIAHHSLAQNDPAQPQTEGEKHRSHGDEGFEQAVTWCLQYDKFPEILREFMVRSELCQKLGYDAETMAKQTAPPSKHCGGCTVDSCIVN